MQINHFLLLKKLKNTESAQLWAGGHFRVSFEWKATFRKENEL